MWICEINGNRGKRVTMKKRSKRYREILKSTLKNKKANIKEAIDLVKKNSNLKDTKFKK